MTERLLKIYVDESLEQQLKAAEKEYPYLLEQMNIVNEYWNMFPYARYDLFIDFEAHDVLTEKYYTLKKAIKAMLYMKEANDVLIKSGYEGLGKYIDMSSVDEVVSDPYHGWDTRFLKEFVQLLEMAQTVSANKRQERLNEMTRRAELRNTYREAGEKERQFTHLNMDDLLEELYDYNLKRMGTTREQVEKEQREKEESRALRAYIMKELLGLDPDK